MKRVLFIDRDGTLIIEPEDKQIDSLEKLEFMPGVFRGLSAIAAQSDFELVIVSNQDGLGTSSFPEDTFWPAQNKMLQALANEGIQFADIHIDPSFPEDNAPTRKPRTGMLQKYFFADYDLPNSYVIGDRLTDLELAKNLGAKGIVFGPSNRRAEIEDAGLSPSLAMLTQSWSDISDFLLSDNRRAFVERKTKETCISVELKLDGSGRSSISTGLGFFNHMLEQIAGHSGCDLTITAVGDLKVDEHHTIEDTAITLGQAFLKALGNKVGLERYGFCLPMDDCLAQVAIDFGGRPWLVWDAEFKREHIGEMPSEMFMHFFKSFSDAALCNLNIRAEGSNEHHKIESIFKCFAHALKMAIRKDKHSTSLPSTKGVI